eukprot:CAMPEP_0114985354 /NCGR_PEP_ID=MMETSP0216-20121206/7809_1 /TAXON_ID=223996 /ORGANISM="Protocruzia adherens, Strain Boccale" /LENGTH=355 /DNA_ID=CAMNT_0002347639 /DNA_START=30 /DNA_END=1094 /DNA_ORIENTATION=+
MVLKCQECRQAFEIQGSGDNYPIDESQKIDIAQSFVLLKEQIKDTHANISEYVEHTKQLNAILNEGAEVNIPLCMDCFQKIISNMSSTIDELTEEKNMYAKKIKEAEKEIEAAQGKLDTQPLVSLEDYERDQKERLESLELEERQQFEEIKELEEKAAKLKVEEDEFWKNMNDFEIALVNFEENDARVDRIMVQAKSELDRLSSINVLNDVFKISALNHFATINGFRMGRLVTQTVPWDEINAGWGQCVFLLVTLADRIGYKFKKYNLLPMGNYSKIGLKSDPQIVFELYQPSNEERYNKALKMFLECADELRTQLQTLAEKRKNFKNLQWGYEMKEDSIGMIPITYNSAKLENW